MLYHLVFDEEFLSGRCLVLPADKVRNLLILGLFDRALVCLLTLAEDILLNPVNTYNPN